MMDDEQATRRKLRLRKIEMQILAPDNIQFTEFC